MVGEAVARKKRSDFTLWPAASRATLETDAQSRASVLPFDALENAAHLYFAKARKESYGRVYKVGGQLRLHAD